MHLKEKIRRRLPTLGTHVNLRDPIVTEILGSLGFDFLWIDMEHVALSEQDVYHHLLAARSVGTPVLVRVPVDDLTATKRVLEMGVDGIIFPMVQNAQHAKKLLDHTLYPPYGTRGCGPKSAVRYGLDNELDFYKEGHLQALRFVQIEQESAARDAQNIAALEHLDGCILGMHDLSGSIHKLGEIFSKENTALAEMAINAFTAANKSVGISTYAIDEETLTRYRDMGINMISTGADYDYILKLGRQTLTLAKELMHGKSPKGGTMA